MSHPKNTYTLVADIGGTNTRVALAQGRELLPSTIRRYANTDYAGLEAVLRQYISDENGVDPLAACVAVAGPVSEGRATLTNLDWTIDNETLARATQAENVSILNDLQAQGHAIGFVEDDKIRTIVPGPDKGPDATKLVIGVGTGFNAAPVYETGQRRLVTPSEAGHANLPIRTEQELELCKFVSNAHGFPAVEDVLSGRGLERVYSFLAKGSNDAQEKSAAEIVAACTAGDDPLAEETGKLFCKILGTVCGNLSLIHLPFSGVYLIGGVARAFTEDLNRFGFAEAFRDKGRFAGFMGNFRVSIIEDDYAALIGCAAHMVEELSAG